MSSFSISNVIVAYSNVWAMNPIKLAYLRGKYVDTGLLIGAMGSSILYHSAEYSKHYMVGLEILKPFEQILLNTDRFFAVATICYFVYNYFPTIKYLLKYNTNFKWTSVLGITYGLFSELGMKLFNHVLSVPEHQVLYVISHCIWHYLAFDTAFQILENSP